jgi:proline racemase
MSRFTFSCIDGQTCGNPVRVVTGGGIRSCAAPP